ncbi:GNAT family N-acetyltransferase [Metabacillus sp. RGM 3146]|uniref:GNAT family N-acetyltransferase n=1 Tax=Metabacillus sp. RGM 3146 TaxID=3401092 RepID=UPI003B9DA19C
MLKLVKPSIELEEEYMAFYQDWMISGEKIVPWIIGRDPSSFQDQVAYCRDQEREENVQETFVPNSTYLLKNEQSEIVAAVNIRHRLNDYLLQRGGHIGYGVAPSKRQRGYATATLSLALEKTREMGIQDALVTCDGDNTASEKTILKNGGVFESDFIEENGNIVKRYWIRTN